MMAAAKIGYDGNPPEFHEKRGSEVRDRLTGAIIRQGEMSPLNVSTDRLEWLLAHKRISRPQYDAGQRLQKDSEQAQIGGFASLGALPGGSGTTRLSDAKCDAIKAVNDVRTLIRGMGWRILELVVLENVSLAKAESRLRLPVGGGHGALIVALDLLASHYGLA